MIRRVPSATTADAAVEHYLQLQRSYLRGSKPTTTTSIDQQLPAHIYGCEDKSELSPDDEDYYSQPPPPIVDVQPIVSTTIPSKSCQPPTSIVGTIRKNAEKSSNSWLTWLITFLLVIVSVVLVLCIILFLLLDRSTYRRTWTSPFSSSSIVNVDHRHQTAPVTIDVEMSAIALMTAIKTRRKLCLFEAIPNDDSIDQQLVPYRQAHIRSARPFTFANVTEKVGAIEQRPVHPIDFQTYLDAIGGVDTDCHVVFYHRETGQFRWAAYGYWLFRLYGHEKVSILDGGYPRWQHLRQQNDQYAIDEGSNIIDSITGTFRARWNNDQIATFVDVLDAVNDDTTTIVDVRSSIDFESNQTIGHIVNAINIPIESILYNDDRWRYGDDLSEQFRLMNRTRPMIIYGSSLMQSTILWMRMLKHNDAHAKVYIGGYNEWMLRRPDQLK